MATIMDQLLDQVLDTSDRQKDELVRIASPQNPALVVVCKIPANGVRIAKMQARAKIPDKGEAQGPLFARALVAACTESIEYAGDPLVNSEGDVTNFRDPVLHRKLTARDAEKVAEEARNRPDGKPTRAPIVFDASLSAEAVLGGDGPVSTIAAELMRLANYVSAAEASLPLDD